MEIVVDTRETRKPHVVLAFIAGFLGMGLGYCRGRAGAGARMARSDGELRPTKNAALADCDDGLALEAVEEM
jgi:hypothetical protein